MVELSSELSSRGDGGLRSRELATLKQRLDSGQGKGMWMMLATGTRITIGEASGWSRREKLKMPSSAAASCTAEQMLDSTSHAPEGGWMSPTKVKCGLNAGVERVVDREAMQCTCLGTWSLTQSARGVAA